MKRKLISVLLALSMVLSFSATSLLPTVSGQGPQQADSVCCGDVDGNGSRGIGDAVDILCYLAKLQSRVSTSDVARRSAILTATQRAKPDAGVAYPVIGDAVEILCLLAKLPNVIVIRPVKNPAIADPKDCGCCKVCNQWWECICPPTGETCPECHELLTECECERCFKCKELRKDCPCVADPECDCPKCIRHPDVKLPCPDCCEYHPGEPNNPCIECLKKECDERGRCTPGLEETCVDPQTCTSCFRLVKSPKTHNFGAATCTTAATCGNTSRGVKCTETQGTPLDHDFSVPATCVWAKKCVRCPATEGVPNPHDYAPATCKVSEICKNCNHDNGGRMACKVTVPATCTKGVSCSMCGDEYGLPLGHDWGGVDCMKCDRAGCTATIGVRQCGQSPKTCTVEDHKTCPVGTCIPGRVADCTNDQVCAIPTCQAVLASAKGHNASNPSSTCTTEKVCANAGCTHVIEPKKAHNVRPASCTVESRCYDCNVFISGTVQHTPAKQSDCRICDNCTTELDRRCTTTAHCTHHTPPDVCLMNGHDLSSPVKATCTTPQICARANCNEPVAWRDHNWNTPAANCTIRKYCLWTDCGYEQEAAKGHDFPLPSCAKRQECRRQDCDGVGDNALPHVYSSNDCQKCAGCTFTWPTQQCLATAPCPKHPPQETCLKNGHIPGPEATCATPQLCIRVGGCNGTLVAAINHVGFVELTTPNSAPTCTSDGYDTRKCTKCELVLGTQVNPYLGHDYSVPATCTTAKKCVRCVATSGDPLYHDWNNQANCMVCVRDSSHTTPNRNCTSSNPCDLPAHQTNPCLQGDHKNLGPAADCLNPQKCNDCGAVTDPAKGHTQQTFVYTVLTQATCLSLGEEVEYCANCTTHIIGRRDIPKKAHVADKVVNCLICKDCGANIIPQDLCLEAAPCQYHIEWCRIHPGQRNPCAICNGCGENNHIYAWVTTAEASCVGTGWKVERCTRLVLGVVCNYQKPGGSQVDALGHDETAASVINPQPTCDTSGKETKRCPRVNSGTLCNAIVLDKTIEQLGHDWSNPANCMICVRDNTHNTTPNRHCNSSNPCNLPAHQTNPCDQGNHQNKGPAANCVDDQLCLDCGTPVKVATGHDPGNWEVSTPATCTAPGEEVKKCRNANCPDVIRETQPIAIKNHTPKTSNCNHCNTCNKTDLPLVCNTWVAPCPAHEEWCLDNPAHLYVYRNPCPICKPCTHPSGYTSSTCIVAGVCIDGCGKQAALAAHTQEFVINCEVCTVCAVGKPTVTFPTRCLVATPCDYHKNLDDPCVAPGAHNYKGATCVDGTTTGDAKCVNIKPSTGLPCGAVDVGSNAGPHIWDGPYCEEAARCNKTLTREDGTQYQCYKEGPPAIGHNAGPNVGLGATCTTASTLKQNCTNHDCTEVVWADDTPALGHTAPDNINCMICTRCSPPLLARRCLEAAPCAEHGSCDPHVPSGTFPCEVGQTCVLCFEPIASTPHTFQPFNADQEIYTNCRLCTVCGLDTARPKACADPPGLCKAHAGEVCPICSLPFDDCEDGDCTHPLGTVCTCPQTLRDVSRDQRNRISRDRTGYLPPKPAGGGEVGADNATIRKQCSNTYPTQCTNVNEPVCQNCGYCRPCEWKYFGGIHCNRCEWGTDCIASLRGLRPEGSAALLPGEPVREYIRFCYEKNTCTKCCVAVGGHCTSSDEIPFLPVGAVERDVLCQFNCGRKSVCTDACKNHPIDACARCSWRGFGVVTCSGCSRTSDCISASGGQWNYATGKCGWCSP